MILILVLGLFGGGNPRNCTENREGLPEITSLRKGAEYQDAVMSGHSYNSRLICPQELCLSHHFSKVRLLLKSEHLFQQNGFPKLTSWDLIERNSYYHKCVTHTALCIQHTVSAAHRYPLAAVQTELGQRMLSFSHWP